MVLCNYYYINFTATKINEGLCTHNWENCYWCFNFIIIISYYQKHFVIGDVSLIKRKETDSSPHMKTIISRCWSAISDEEHSISYITFFNTSFNLFWSTLANVPPNNNYWLIKLEGRYKFLVSVLKHTLTGNSIGRPMLLARKLDFLYFSCCPFSTKNHEWKWILITINYHDADNDNSLSYQFFTKFNLMSNLEIIKAQKNNLFCTSTRKLVSYSSFQGWTCTTIVELSLIW